MIELLLTEEEAAAGGYAMISVTAPSLLTHWVTIPAAAADGQTLTSVAQARSERSELQLRIRVRC